MTNREAVSITRSRHRLFSADAKINDRTILREMRSTSLLLAKRETNLRKLWNTASLFTTLPCIEMEPVPLAECCDYVSDKMIGKSKYKLPKIAEGQYAYIIKGIFNIEGNIKLTEVTLTRYLNLLKLGLPSKTYVWIGDDNHLYCSDELVDKLKLVAFLEEDPIDDLLYPSCDCETNVKPKCENPLDREFKAPGYLIDNIADIVSQKLLGTYFKIPQDATNDGKDSQVQNT